MSTQAVGRGTEQIRGAALRLEAAGVPSPRHDAEILAAYVLGCGRGSLALASFGSESRARYEAVVARRAAREPLQHLTGTAPFRHLELAVGPGVFIPRPETEGLVDLVLPACGPGRQVVDLCAGSGAIALAIAGERPGTGVYAVEASADAVRWLRLNAGPSVIVRHAAAADALPGQQVDVVVSNPPYLPTGLAVDPEVGHDPADALWGGRDGLTVIREVVEAAARLLVPGGLLALEHDVSHQQLVRDCLRHNDFDDVRGHRDLAGRDRYVTGVRMHP